jgi:pimeloyl-ACP methyl ester carboxylesterase
MTVRPDASQIAAIPDVRFRTVDGVRLRYADSGGSQAPTVLLTSPWPESLYAFAPMWATLAEQARLFAVDLPGFGASERRDDLCRHEPWATSWPSSSSKPI